MTTLRGVGRLLRVLRIAAGLRVEDAAAEAEITLDRLCELEAGIASLGYLEGLVLAKTLLLCPTCFARHVRAATARDGWRSIDEVAPGGER